MVPALAFLSSWPCGCCTRAKPSAGWPWSPTMMTTIIVRWSQHLALFPFSPCGWSTGKWPTLGWSPLQYETPSFSTIILICEGWPPHHLCDPISVPSLQIVDGSRVTSLATLLFSPSLLSSLEFDGQPWVPHCPFVAGPFARLSSPWRSFPGSLPLVFLPLIRDGRHCGWHGAPRLLSLVRYRGVGWTLLIDLWQSPCWLRPFLLLVFHPALPFLLGFAVLADASTAYAIVSHPNLLLHRTIGIICRV